VKEYQMLIGGEWVPAAGGTTFETVDPYVTEPWARLPRADERDAARAVAAAKTALGSPQWAGLTPTRRGALLRRLAELIEQNVERLAEVESRDNGKIMPETRGLAIYAAQIFHYYAGMADKIEGAVIPVDRPNFLTFTRSEPVGVVAVIIPWNSPMLMVAGGIAPALAAGCTVVLKPSEHASASSLEFARLVEQAGIPPGVVNVITGFGAEVGTALTEHPDVAAIAFTGGEATGMRIGEAAARGLKQVCLELGGKSANIVFDDADFERAARGCVAGIFTSGGQSCIAGSRLLVQRGMHDAFVERVIELASGIKAGDPRAPGTTLGPVANEAQLNKILEFVERAPAEGARCVLGGKRLHEDKWFVEPTIFTGVRPDMHIACEEVFGPVLSVIPFDDEAEAIEIANGTRFGLAGAAWTSDIPKALRVAGAVQAGTFWINNYRVVSMMAPFGGTKNSGHGRVNGFAGLHEFLVSKTIWLDTGNEIPDPFAVRI